MVSIAFQTFWWLSTPSLLAAEIRGVEAGLEMVNACLLYPRIVIASDLSGVITVPSHSIGIIPALVTGRASMATERFSEEEITAWARQLANEQGPGWEAITAEERVGKDTAELRYWREMALKELEAEQPTVLEVEASTPKTVGLE
jgi:hypothetical protein